MSRLEAYYGLPEEVKYCTRCVISNQRPSSVVEFKNRPGVRKPTIEFNEEGVCSACQFQDVKDTQIDWAAREEELRKLCDQFRSKRGNYDCVVPGSGGKDSAFTSHILKYKFGMHPLTVTWTPHKYTEIGFQNFQNWIHSGFDNILYSPDGKVHRLLTKLAFENLVHPFQPFILGQKSIGPRFSSLFGIPLIFYGENQAEYGNNIKENNRATMGIEFFSGPEEPDFDSIFLGGLPAREIMGKYNIEEGELYPYIAVGRDRLEKVGTQVHYMSYYIKWDPQEVYYYAAQNTKFQTNTERTEGSYSKYSSIDDKIDPLHYYTTLAKFGLGRASYDASQEIRNKKITREEGVALVRKYDCEFPSKFFKEILEYMDLHEGRFWEIIDKARSPHLWIKEKGEWRLRMPIWEWDEARGQA